MWNSIVEKETTKDFCSNISTKNVEKEKRKQMTADFDVMRFVEKLIVVEVIRNQLADYCNDYMMCDRQWIQHWMLLSIE